MRGLCVRLILPVCCAALLCATPANAQAVDESFRSDVEKLMEATGAARIGTQLAGMVISQIFTGMKQSQPQMPDRAMELIQETVTTELKKAFEGPDSLVQQMIPIYAKYFTRDDVRELLAFYESPLGRKMVQNMPLLLQDSAMVGGQWAQREMPRIGALVDARLRAEGLIK